MIEKTFERIAIALEALVALAGGKVTTVSGETKIAEAAASATAAVPAAPKKPLGRPPKNKVTETEKAEATPAVIVAKPPLPETDEFLNGVPAKAVEKELTVADVRAALKDYANQIGSNGAPKGMAEARVLLKQSGNGALRLEEDPKLANGKDGVLDKKYYATVIAATKDAGEEDVDL